jgi:Mannose-6-phosphate isomerase
MNRRSFCEALSAVPLGLVSQQPEKSALTAAGVRVPAGNDRFNTPLHLPTDTPLWVKVASTDTAGGFFLTEQTHTRKGGPRLHFHFDQDEWWYCLAGQYAVQVGTARFELKPGDTVFGPKRVPHTFALVSETPGKILVGFAPAGRMEDLFREQARRGRGFGDGDAADQQQLRDFGIQNVGPALSV